MASPIAVQAPPLAGYAEELARAEGDIARLELRRRSHPGDLEQRVRLAFRLFHRASLTGLLAHFEQADAAIVEALADFGAKEDLCLLKANLEFRFHRNGAARRQVHRSPLLAGRLEGRVLLADLDFQEGRYEAARVELERVLQENRAWDTLARLAYWHGKLGDPAEADRLYEEAEDDLTAKQMRSFAWLELQRGVLAFTHGQFGAARRHYERAERAYPGHWHTAEHAAELMAAEGRFEEAAAAFLAVIDRAPKPELQQALGEVYLLAGRPSDAQHWLDVALAAYLQSADRGEVHYYHHLADFYTDARPDGAEAVRWARKDLELRPNFSTQAALARALHRNGRIPEAAEYIRLALASGVKDAGIFAGAAAIFEAGGASEESRRCAEEAARINCRHGCFHMHH